MTTTTTQRHATDSKLPGGPGTATQGRPATDAVAKVPTAIEDQQVPDSRPGLTLRWSLPVVRLVAIGLLAAAAAVLAWTLLPLTWGWTSAVIVSGSMSPRVHRGDVVISSPPGPDWQPAVGQVVTVPDQVHPGQTLTHRIVGFDEQGRLLTRGDANGSDDPFRTNRDQVRGIGRLLVPRIGLATLLLREGHPAMFVTQSLLVLAALGLVLRLPATPRLRAAAEAPTQTAPQAEAPTQTAPETEAPTQSAPETEASPQSPGRAEVSLQARPKRPVDTRPRQKHPRNARPNGKRKTHA
ncbi:signal peptidase I [Krasilnikovia cinnamomea]|uniref:Signal peptidase I n=1 Tax=Krasilnikovia cinnamomea TaxID=349313 RepID=A0A4Q7ZQV5_9ACTN|nr:S26 family signal peptidase [Krasilnikovia cinnamomea]RZU52769.1 signal peptidase I [Krasilnikovia cinnamomea]